MSQHAFRSLLLAGLVASPAAWAQDEDAPETAEAPEKAEKAEKPAKSGEPAFTMEGPWNPKPYAQPVFGAMVVNGLYGVSVGVEGGFRYAQEKKHPIFFGKTRAQGAYTFGNVQGWDARIGSFFGPFHKVVGLQTGPDVFVSQYSTSNIVADQVVGLDWPITGLLDLKVFNVYAGVSPGWYFSGDREKLSSGVHQLTTYAGVGIKIKNFGVGVGYSKLFLGDFTSDGWSFGISL